MKLIAASGKVAIHAKDDDIELVAKKVLSLISDSDWVDIRGRLGVRLHGANSMVEISEKVQFFTSSPTLFHGNLETLEPRAMPAEPSESNHYPEINELLNELAWVEFRLSDGDNPIAGQPFILSDPEGKRHNGAVDSEGSARISDIKQGRCTVEFPNLGYTTEIGP
jgi:uncharacterized protein (DUF2345 family)